MSSGALLRRRVFSSVRFGLVNKLELSFLYLLELAPGRLFFSPLDGRFCSISAAKCAADFFVSSALFSSIVPFTIPTPHGWLVQFTPDDTLNKHLSSATLDISQSCSTVKSEPAMMRKEEEKEYQTSLLELKMTAQFEANCRLVQSFVLAHSLLFTILAL